MPSLPSRRLRLSRYRQEKVLDTQLLFPSQAGFSGSNLYYLGAAQKAAGKKNDAIVNLKAAVQANPKNRFDGKVSAVYNVYCLIIVIVHSAHHYL